MAKDSPDEKWCARLIVNGETMTKMIAAGLAYLFIASSQANAESLSFSGVVPEFSAKQKHALERKHGPLHNHLLGPFYASREDHDAINQAINDMVSVEQVKTMVRATMEETGMDCAPECANNNGAISAGSTDICTAVAMLDIHLAQAITKPKAKGRPDFPISKSDLRLFKMIWAQCEFTDFRTWDDKPYQFHVAYEPAPHNKGADGKIRRALSGKEVVK